jgi:hypothetical protein
MAIRDRRRQELGFTNGRLPGCLGSADNATAPGPMHSVLKHVRRPAAKCRRIYRDQFRSKSSDIIVIQQEGA